MARQLVPVVLVLAFGGIVGHVAWHALVGPPRPPEYVVGGEGPVLGGTDPDRRMLYLRRKLFLSRRPDHAWLQVVGRDRIHLYVNGKKVGDRRREGFPVGMVVDLAPLLNKGLNVLAINAEQASIRYPPAVSVAGTYVIGGRQYPIVGDDSWRSSAVFERGASFWYARGFDDRNWPHARVTQGRLEVAVKAPPRLTTEPDVGRWVSCPLGTARQVALRREVEVAGRPRAAWLRVTATAPYVLAVNGTVVDAPDEELGTEAPASPVRRLYDLTPVVCRGQNTVAFWLTAAGKTPHLLADFEIEETSGARHHVGSDAGWLCRAGTTPGWSAPRLADSSGWQPALVETGDLGIPPWLPTRKTVAVTLSTEMTLNRLAGQVGLMGVVAALAWLGCWTVGRWLARRRDRGLAEAPPSVGYLALVPAALALAVAVLASFDPRIARQDVYHPAWVWLAVASVPLQWALVAWTARRPASLSPPPALGHGTVVLLLAVVAVGFWLRLRDISVEALMFDEVTFYDATIGFLQRGIPSIRVHPDTPMMDASADEFDMLTTGLVALFTDDPIYIVRLPQVFFGSLVIGLLYLAGRTMFSSATGWLAALFCTFSPACIAMSNYGRYLQQTQFFALLTIYFFWMTVRGTGPLRPRYVWLTAVSYMCMFLCWEPAALMAPGMMLAAVLVRRGHLGTLLKSRSVWTGMGVILTIIILQAAHRNFMQTERIKWHLGLSAMVIKPIWLYPTFDLWYYVRESSWTADTLIPLLGLALAGLFAVRHPFQRPLRFLLVIYLVSCVVMTSLIVIATFRYANFLVPLRVLLASAGFVACARALVRAAGSVRAPALWQWYGYAMALLLLATLAVVGSGATIETPELSSFRASAYGTTVFKFPDMRQPVRYLGEHWRPGDVVIATMPHQVNHLMNRPGWTTNYYLQSVLGNGMELGDSSTMLIDSRSGATTLMGLEDLEDVFARYERVWYVTIPRLHVHFNTAKVSAYIRDHMEVVYEDYDSAVFFRGRRHWPSVQHSPTEGAISSGSGRPSGARGHSTGSHDDDKQGQHSEAQASSSENVPSGLIR